MQSQDKYLDDNEIRLLQVVERDPNDALVLSEKEEELLKLHEQLQDLALQKTILEVHTSETHPPLPNGDTEVALQIEVAEKELLESRGKYTVNRKVIENVMMADPILRAVHGGEDLLPTERALLQLINRRDVLSMVHENLSNSVSSIREAHDAAEVENIKATRKNQQLAEELTALASEMAAQKETIPDETMKARLEEVETETNVERVRWRMLKSITSAVIVASGVDWARDERLCALVTDDEIDEA